MRNFSLEEYIVNHVFICASINSMRPMKRMGLIIFIYGQLLFANQGRNILQGNLTNGVTYGIIQSTSEEASDLQLEIGAGAIHEEPGQNGGAHLLLGKGPSKDFR